MEENSHFKFVHIVRVVIFIQFCYHRFDILIHITIFIYNLSIFKSFASFAS